MTQRIVYVLGAGFSAPVGLPTVSNLLTVSKDMYEGAPDKYGHFLKVFELVRQLHAGKSSFSMDLTNIEEILSLLEVEEFAGSGKNRDNVIDYLRDVVTGPLRPMIKGNAAQASWKSSFLSEDSVWAAYCVFVANLAGCSFRFGADGTIQRSAVVGSAVYSVISLNYDGVLETAARRIAETSGGEAPVGFEVVTSKRRGNGVQLIKLHGSADDRTIVAPTWNKGGRTDLSPAWNAALEVLTGANYIRFLGYSLPESDAYVRYLLKAAGAHAFNLKGVDVICLDPDWGDHQYPVRNRYRSFMKLPFRFASADLEEYLGRLFRVSVNDGTRPNDFGPILETTHEAFMTRL